MDLIIFPDGWGRLGDRRVRAAIGRGGMIVNKIEGDGGTPIGAWACRGVLYRPDRLAAPISQLPVTPLQPDDGWCDDPANPAYNQPVRLPYAGRTESLWREDQVYNLIIPLGYNDNPPRAGFGSAIFLHLARPDFTPTEGCVALGLADLLAFLAVATPSSLVVVQP